MELSDDQLIAMAKDIKEAPEDSCIWLDYRGPTVVVTEHTNYWPLQWPWIYCFMGFAGDLKIKLAKDEQ